MIPRRTIISEKEIADLRVANFPPLKFWDKATSGGRAGKHVKTPHFYMYEYKTALTYTIGSPVQMSTDMTENRRILGEIVRTCTGPGDMDLLYAVFSMGRVTDVPLFCLNIDITMIPESQYKVLSLVVANLPAKTGENSFPILKGEWQAILDEDVRMKRRRAEEIEYCYFITQSRLDAEVRVIVREAPEIKAHEVEVLPVHPSCAMKGEETHDRRDPISEQEKNILRSATEIMTFARAMPLDKTELQTYATSSNMLYSALSTAARIQDFRSVFSNFRHLKRPIHAIADGNAAAQIAGLSLGVKITSSDINRYVVGKKDENGDALDLFPVEVADAKKVIDNLPPETVVIVSHVVDFLPDIVQYVVARRLSIVVFEEYEFYRSSYTLVQPRKSKRIRCTRDLVNYVSDPWSERKQTVTVPFSDHVIMNPAVKVCSIKAAPFLDFFSAIGLSLSITSTELALSDLKEMAWYYRHRVGAAHSLTLIASPTEIAKSTGKLLIPSLEIMTEKEAMFLFDESGVNHFPVNSLIQIKGRVRVSGRVRAIRTKELSYVTCPSKGKYFISIAHGEEEKMRSLSFG